MIVYYEVAARFIEKLFERSGLMALKSEKLLLNSLTFAFLTGLDILNT